MKSLDLITNLKKNYKVVLLIAILIMVASFVISIAMPSKYKSSVQVLVTQNYGPNTDIYAAAKFTEYLSSLLKEVIYSDSFFNQVIHSGYSIVNDFDQRPEKRKNQWKNIVQSKVLSDTGIIAVDVYHSDRNQTDQLANAIGYILTEKNTLYHGAGDQVSVRIIDGPATTKNPVKPNIFLNTAIGLFLGIILGGLFVYLFPEVSLGNFNLRTKKSPDQPSEEISNKYFTPKQDLSQSIVTASAPSTFNPHQYQQSNDFNQNPKVVMEPKTLRQHWGLD